MVVIIDYGMGNLKSVENAISFLGYKAKVTDSKNDIESAKKIIFPGVGNFATAVKELKKRRIFNILKRSIKEGTPYLGICLGMQLLFEESQEAPGVKGLEIIKGQVKKFKAKGLIVPHMGWNRVKLKKDNLNQKGKILFRGIRDSSFFYFVHSYYCKPVCKSVVLSSTDYCSEFVSGIYSGNVWAFQFHVEKSQRLGLKVLNNFLKLC